jgi:hypothetical protein
MASDNFTRTDAAPVGGDWTTVTGCNACDIASNKLVGHVNQDDNNAYYSGTFADDQYSKITIVDSDITVSYYGALGRCSVAAQTFYHFFTSGGAYVRIIKIVAGTLSQPSGGEQVSQAVASGDTMKITVEGSSTVTIKGYVNDTLILTAADSSSPIGSGQPGVMVHSNSQTRGLTAWEGGDLVTASAPTVTSLDVTSGTTAGGTTVTITGTDFVATPAVTFGGDAATSETWVSATSMTCVTPAHAAGAVDVVVTNPDAQTGTKTNGYTYTAAATGGGGMLTLGVG